MVRIAIDAGHGIHTFGKRAPDGVREWSFNNVVALAAIAKLNTFHGVEILRLDDPTGVTDVGLITRTNGVNIWKADVLVSLHHNAHLGKWGSHGGIETYTQPGASQKSRDIAAVVHPLVVKAMGLRDRGLKTMNLHILRESLMPAILVEGGFMDSTVDIIVMRHKKKLQEQGEAIAEGLAVYFKLKPKAGGLKPLEIVYRYGDRGSEIGKLQNDFNSLGYKLVVDNSFGSAVLAVVKSFQRKYGLVVDGEVGVKTQREIKDLLKNKSKKSIATYRVVIDGKQIGTYAEKLNVGEAVKKAVKDKATKIDVYRV